MITVDERYGWLDSDRLPCSPEFHCFRWTGTAPEWQRRQPNTNLPPIFIRDWLAKKDLLQRRAYAREEAIWWLWNEMESTAALLTASWRTNWHHHRDRFEFIWDSLGRDRITLIVARMSDGRDAEWAIVPTSSPELNPRPSARRRI
jgi:hypothetical protein